VKQQELDNTRYKKMAKSGFVVTETATDKLEARVREMEKQNQSVLIHIVSLDFKFTPSRSHKSIMIAGFFNFRVWLGAFSIPNPQVSPDNITSSEREVVQRLNEQLASTSVPEFEATA
jgi:hypothetical protein